MEIQPNLSKAKTFLRDNETKPRKAYASPSPSSGVRLKTIQ